jgi:hypothetical protein
VHVDDGGGAAWPDGVGGAAAEGGGAVALFLGVGIAVQ